MNYNSYSASSQINSQTQPAFQTLSGIQGIWSSLGLKTGVNNEYGSVASDDNLLTWESIRPGPVGRDFTSTGTVGEAIKRVMVNGIPVLDFNGQRWLRHVGGSTTWDFLSHNATFANMRWSITMLVRPGYGSDPGEVVALMGNNGGSSGAKGLGIFMDDRQTIASANRRLSHIMTRGVAGTISQSADNDVIDFNEWHTYTFTFDASLTAANRFKAYREKTQITTTVTSASTATVTAPTYELELMSIGNGAVPSSGQVVAVVIQNVVESQAVREAFVDSLEPIRSALNNHQNDFFHLYNTTQDNGTKYYLPSVLSQHPTDRNKVVKMYRRDNRHVPDNEGIALCELSTDYGLTFGSAVTITDPVDPLAVGGIGGGYDSNGRLWAFVDVRTVSGASNIAPFQFWVYYSDNDGASWTGLDITSLMPADGLSFWSCWGNIMVAPTGRIGFAFYKTNSTGTSSANYFLYTDDDGEQLADWNISTVRALGAPYINETWTLIAGIRLILYARDDDTNEWNVFSSSDWGTTWSDGGPFTLGESFTEPCPLSLWEFDLYGVAVVGFAWCDRFNSKFKVAFARKSALAIDPKDVDLDTKTEIRQRILHYGTIISPWNDFRAIGCFPRENTTSPFGGENQLVCFWIPQILKDLVLRELSISKQ